MRLMVTGRATRAGRSLMTVRGMLRVGRSVSRSASAAAAAGVAAVGSDMTDIADTLRWLAATGRTTLTTSAMVRAVAA